MIDYDTIPHAIRTGIDRYVNEHSPCGGFITAVLSNDLREAVGRADDDSLAALHSIVGYCHNEIPGNCWGSTDKVKAWLAKGDSES